MSRIQMSSFRKKASFLVIFKHCESWQVTFGKRVSRYEWVCYLLPLVYERRNNISNNEKTSYSPVSWHRKSSSKWTPHSFFFPCQTSFRLEKRTVRLSKLTWHVNIEVEAIFRLILQSWPNFSQVFKSPFWHPLQSFSFVGNVRKFLRTNASVAGGSADSTPMDRRTCGWKPRIHQIHITFGCIKESPNTLGLSSRY